MCCLAQQTHQLVGLEQERQQAGKEADAAQFGDFGVGCKRIAQATDDTNE